MNKWGKDKVSSKPDNVVKLSRWWAIYHLWCGACVYMYVNMSGLSDVLIGTPSGPVTDNVARTHG